MTSSSEMPHRWTPASVPSELKEADAIPLTGSAPPFPWAELCKRLSKTFERNIQLELGEIKWRTANELYEGIGDNPFPLNAALPSIKGEICWVMPEKDMAILESLLLINESHPINFQDPALSESFYRFLAIEIVFQMSQIGLDKAIAPNLTGTKILPQEASLCQDICIKIEEISLWGRLIVSQTFRQSWVDYFSKKGPTKRTQELKKQIQGKVHLQVGKTLLTYEEWSKINVGDCILLDISAFKKEGKVVLTLNEKPIRHGKFEDKKLKIL